MNNKRKMKKKKKAELAERRAGFVHNGWEFPISLAGMKWGAEEGKHGSPTSLNSGAKSNTLR
jgi:hypothetical protein